MKDHWTAYTVISFMICTATLKVILHEEIGDTRFADIEIKRLRRKINEVKSE